MDIALNKLDFGETRSGTLNIPKSTVFMVTLLFLLLISNVVLAAEGSLTEIFTTQAFSGTWEVIGKFNFIGQITSALISVFSLIGLCLIVLTQVFTYTYLSSRSVWDEVWEIKQDMKNSSFMGLPSLFQNSFGAKYDSGFDVITGFVFGLLPNVKKYSDYNPDRMGQGLSEEDNAGQHFTKTFIGIVFSVFLLTMGYNGTLMKGYGVVVDALAVAADNIVSVNLAGMVDDWMKQGNNPEFSIGADGSNYSKVMSKVTQEIYKNVISKDGISSTEDRTYIGNRVEQFIQSQATQSIINTAYLGGQATDDSAWKYVKYNMVVTKNKAASGAALTFSFQANVDGNLSPYYVHTYFKITGKDAPSFVVPGGKK